VANTGLSGRGLEPPRPTARSAAGLDGSSHLYVAPFPLTTLERLDRSRQGLFWAGVPKCSGVRARSPGSWLKADGGLGLKDLEMLNTSLLVKHVQSFSPAPSTPGWTRCGTGTIAALLTTTLRACNILEIACCQKYGFQNFCFEHECT
jgi:hypothetical protein